jgi:muramoyltetrapeptide carboxypeptidase
MEKTVGIASISADFDKKILKKSIKELESKGFYAKYDKKILKEKNDIFSNKINFRINNFINIIKSKEINYVLFPRGGYGTNQILNDLDKVDLKNYLKNKKLIGYSDITALFLYFYKKYKIKTFYGPNLTSTFFKVSSLKKINEPLNEKIKILKKHNQISVKGTIIGGCLCIISSLCGTKFIPDLNNKILFIEDLNEKPYKIDRMLSQIFFSYSKIKAIVIGGMKNCKSGEITWKKPLLRISELYKIPVVYGLKAGHSGFKNIVPLGKTATINLKNKTIKI